MMGGTGLFKRRFYMNVAIMCRALRQKLLGHYLYYGMSGNTWGIKSYYYHTVRLAFKWINRRSQNNHLTYTLFKGRGCVPEEQDEVKPQVLFCEGAHSNLGANTPIGDGL
jgi:hypothetical protein